MEFKHSNTMVSIFLYKLFLGHFHLRTDTDLLKRPGVNVYFHIILTFVT